mgnify:FL=1
MATFDLNILGCGSALPTTRHNASSQVINLRDKLYMIDCGEGTQLQMRKMKIKFSRLNHIFISHLHGDHCLGLPGLVSTLGMLGRMGDLFIYGPAEVGEYVQVIEKLFCQGSPFQMKFQAVDTNNYNLVMEDRSVSVYSLPMKHRVPCCGYLFVEKKRSPHIIREMIDFYKIPISKIELIKQGADFVTEEGEVIPNKILTRPAEPAKRYAYCSDTAFFPKIVPYIEGVDLLYHEATFLEADSARAYETFHSTTKQAASIARDAQVKKLLIGHYSARYIDLLPLEKEARSIFHNTLLANEGMVLSL